MTVVKSNVPKCAKPMKQAKPKSKPIKGLTSGKFKVSSHNLPKRKLKYGCQNGCGASFNSVRPRNIHHLAKHRNITYVCDNCGKTLATPSSYHDHQYYHRESRFNCNKCDKCICLNVDFILTRTYIGDKNCMCALLPSVIKPISGHKTCCDMYNNM